MTGLRHQLRLPGIVFGTIAAILFLAGEVSACSPKAGRNSTGGCCSGRAESACCCEPAGVKSRPASAVRSTVLPPAKAGLFAPEPLCECRSGAPNEPASKSESRSPERRAEQDRAGSVELPFDIRPMIAPARLVLPTERPPRAPLYIRTSRLLI